MTNVEFSIDSTRFDEDYHPLANSRTTTNFANLARGEKRQENLRKTFAMIDRRFNELATAGNEDGTRYSVELDIISASVDIDGEGLRDAVPLIEVLQTTVIDRRSGERIEGVVGNNFSSYVRDYDFSILLPAFSARASGPGLPDDFGELHGKLFKAFLRSEAWAERFAKPPIICLSVSTSKTYHRTENRHPALGVEYRQSAYSQTDAYFEKMGLQVRFFMPPNSVAPLAFYHLGDLAGDYTDLELVSTISTMETFQKIYRPEIYNARSAAGATYQASLANQDFEATSIDYDREERTRLALEQARFAEKHFITPHKAALDQWSTGVAVPPLEPHGEPS
ncbi:putative oxygenase MesX [Agreia sp. COWG]|uniref:putative oxygenase MesX n=1 Tax=Agreia sp. COWG TaxID=2773266 RepID=UPI001928E3D4|nr:putative oxygenase MesX [Agreia sp. COWG]CAD6002721.1 conserved protein of unknown function [Agreia sp. COWG]